MDRYGSWRVGGDKCYFISKNGTGSGPTPHIKGYSEYIIHERNHEIRMVHSQVEKKSVIRNVEKLAEAEVDCNKDKRKCTYKK